MATGAIQYLRPIHLPTASRITLAENIAGQFLDPVGIIRLRLCRQSERLVDDQRLGRVMCSGNSQHLPATAGHIPIETGLPKSLGQCDDASSAPQQRREQFARALVSKLLTYALGRSLELEDEPLIDELSANFAENNYRLPDLMKNIVTSRTFLWR